MRMENLKGLNLFVDQINILTVCNLYGLTSIMAVEIARPKLKDDENSKTG